ncbi:MAG: hypothetical protein LBG60_12940 [Bifidobacteriaceae bacterium]|jgi:hypothetical protein|nr:hypothetical protein [Bifidobacteriaceae bacterium]
MNKGNFLRMAAAGLGALLVAGVAGAAFADDTDTVNETDLLVTVGPLSTGALTLSVAGPSATFAEDTSNADTAIRVFTATLPDVTVSDTRAAADIDPAYAWYVVGTATDFEDVANVAADIPAGRLGWTPALASSVDPSEVSEGDPVLTTYDARTTVDPVPADNVGLVGSELFALAGGSAAINPTGSWTGNAALVLKADATVAPASYKSVLTLSLFED